MPPCLSRKPKRAESEIPSLPEAGPAVFSFERQHGKINGYLLRELLGYTMLLPHGQTALGPAVCCCFWVSLCCLLSEDFQPCTAIKISVCSLFLSVCVPLFLSPSFQLLITYAILSQGCNSVTNITNTPSLSQIITISLPFASLCANMVVDVTLTSTHIYPDESTGRISAMLCLYFLPRSTMDTSQTVPR